MPLTDTACRKAQPGEKDYKLGDAGGLYLLVKAKTGYRSWRFKYRFGGKERRIVFGAYPEVSLTEARDRRDAARKLLRENIDPGVEREKAKATAVADHEATFESVARRWHDRQQSRWTDRYARLIMFALDRDVFPKLGKLPVGSISGAQVLAMLRAIEQRGAIETAHRIRQQVSAIFVFAMAEGLVRNDVAASLAKGLTPVPKAQKFAAITDLGELRAFVRDFDGMKNVGAVVRFASRLLALTAVRPGVIAGALWSEIGGIDWDGNFIGPMRPLWRIPAVRMKLHVDQKDEISFDHILPLSAQAVDLLRHVRRETGRSAYIFPSARAWRRPMSGDAIRMAYRRLGYGDRHVPHGWRSAFSTIMNDRAKAAVKRGDISRKDDRQYIDLMLAHVPEGMSASELRYNRQEHMADFRRIAQEWADALLAGQKSAGDLLFID